MQILTLAHTCGSLSSSLHGLRNPGLWNDHFSCRTYALDTRVCCKDGDRFASVFMIFADLGESHSGYARGQHDVRHRSTIPPILPTLLLPLVPWARSVAGLDMPNGAFGKLTLKSISI